MHLDIPATPASVAAVYSVDSMRTVHHSTAVVVHTDLEVVEAAGTAVPTVVHNNPLDRIGVAQVDSPPRTCLLW